jgi:hypothetical protein
MSNEQSGPNNDVQYKQIEYKDTNTNCMARGCNNAATYDIKLAVVRRSGKFCTSCKEYFEARDLIISCYIINLGSTEGKFQTSGKSAIEQKV